MDFNIEPGFGRTMDPDMVLDSILLLDVTMATQIVIAQAAEWPWDTNTVSGEHFAFDGTFCGG